MAALHPLAPDMRRRRALAVIGGLSAWLAAGSGSRAEPAACAVPAAPDSLRGAACSRGRLFGAAVATDDLALPGFAELVIRECALIVPTWEMKWGHLQKARGAFNFAAADRLVVFARANRMALRGHTLVWHRNYPAWLPACLASVDYAEVLDQHIAAVCGRYSHAATSWDVVNEAVEPEDGRGDGLRDSFWLKVAGFDYIRRAFELAAAYAPGAELVYNDYGCEGEAAWCLRRRTAVLRLLERLKAAGAPVHALGLQSHLRVGDAFSARGLAGFLREVEGLGVKPIVTELEVRGDRVHGADGKDQAVARLYRDYLDTVLTHSRCDTVVTWGLSDRHSWRLEEDPTDRPLPFDAQLRPKPAFHALRAALRV